MSERKQGGEYSDKPSSTASPGEPPPKAASGFLGWIEWAGNKLPDPAVLFLLAMLITWFLSLGLSYVEFTEEDPRTKLPIVVNNQLSPQALVEFLSKMVTTFTSFAPLGVVLVALLGVGVAEQTGFIGAFIKLLLQVTPRMLLTPMLILVGIVSHTAGDTGYVLVIPLGGVIFYTAGRHPLAGIAAAFAAVSGGFSANFIPSSLDTMLQGFTQQSAQLIDQARTVNPLCNWYFMSCSCLVIVCAGWFLTDFVLEPRLRNANPVDGNPADMPKIDPLTQHEVFSFLVAAGVFAGLVVLLVVACLVPGTPFGHPKTGELGVNGSPLMNSIVPLIFLFFLIPAVVFGVLVGSVKESKDVVKAMAKSMSGMGYYLVMAFCAAQFTYAFGNSNIGALAALKGGALLRSLALPAEATILGIIILTSLVNLLIGSASAKWALIGPIFVPMLMQVDLSPELTQAAYRIGDSSTNIITPLMPYFPLVVAYSQRYVKNTGVGTLISMMISYSLTFLATWTVFLLFYWKVLGMPLGPDSPYTIGQ